MKDYRYLKALVRENLRLRHHCSECLLITVLLENMTSLLHIKVRIWYNQWAQRDFYRTIPTLTAVVWLKCVDTARYTKQFLNLLWQRTFVACTFVCKCFSCELMIFHGLPYKLMQNYFHFFSFNCTYNTVNQFMKWEHTKSYRFSSIDRSPDGVDIYIHILVFKTKNIACFLFWKYFLQEITRQIFTSR